MHLGRPRAKETAWAGRSSSEGQFSKFCVHGAPLEFYFKLRVLGPSPGGPGMRLKWEPQVIPWSFFG